MISRLFKIGKLCFRVNSPESIVPPEHFLLFECDEGEAGYEYDIRIAEELPKPRGDLVAQRDAVTIFRNGEYENRLLSMAGKEGDYGYYEEQTHDRALVSIDPKYMDLLELDTVFTSLFALERRAISFEGIVLHSACICYNDGAILFSAPSGTGKSTQAALWEEHCGARVLNGDRTLLIKEDGRWMAAGWPVCGSSEICSNEKWPVGAIVTLEQAPENSVSELSGMQAFRKLYSEITVNTWDKKVSVKAMDLLDDVIASVPVRHLACDISKEAVEVLRKELF